MRRKYRSSRLNRVSQAQLAREKRVSGPIRVVPGRFSPEKCPYCGGGRLTVSSDGRTKCGWCVPPGGVVSNAAFEAEEDAK